MPVGAGALRRPESRRAEPFWRALTRWDLPRLFSLSFGLVFVIVGLLGFLVTGFGSLLGSTGILVFFALNPLHNLAHTLIGALWLVSAARTDTARSATQIFGSVYLLLAILGFLQVGAALTALGLNAADNILHLVTGLAALGVGFFASRTPDPLDA